MRVSDEAVARDREKSRLRAAARREANREEARKYNNEYVEKNREKINDQRRMRYGADIERFASRPFICWDGEGYTDGSGSHHYMLFGCSMFPSDPLRAIDLSTKTCLDYILYVESLYPDAFHVGFAFGYDVNMILRDLPSRCLRHLADYGVCHWEKYRLAYIPGKTFRVTKKIDGVKVTATIDDMFGFFHSKYTTALLKFGVTDEETIRDIVAGKDDRPNFTYDDIEYVTRYWQAEIGQFAPLADKVRDACYDAGFFVTQWYGPGALAAYILRKRGVKKWHSKEAPNEVQLAIQTAYAGGRFLPWRCGLYYHSIYTADINSAYIYACSLLPNLANGRWRRIPAGSVDRQNIARYGIYRIAYDAGTEKAKRNRSMGAFEEIHPLFHRDNRNQVSWPHRTIGWYWSPEANTVADNPSATFMEAWVFDDDGTYPFEWVHTEFDKRLALQREGNPAEKTFKWALAAMYGAFARQVGWDRKNRKPPSSHELGWAGFITSWCRAEMYRVAFEVWRRGGLVSIDTDGVTSTVPFDAEWLDRGVGATLGQWKLEQFEGILYWQTGFYWLLDKNGEWSTAKTRGVKRGSLDVQAAFAGLAESNYRYDDIRHATITKEGTRFVGFKEALNRGSIKKACRWVPMTQTAVMGQGSTYKHVPHFCRKCRSPDADIMHVLTHIPPRTVESKPHDLPWLMEQPSLGKAQVFPDFIVRDGDLEDNL